MRECIFWFLVILSLIESATCNNTCCNLLVEISNAQGSGRGHNLGDPSSRKEQGGERGLYGANLHLVRALIHSSMIWGMTEHTEVCF